MRFVRWFPVFLLGCLLAGLAAPGGLGATTAQYPRSDAPWRILVNDPAPGRETALPANALQRVAWWPGVNPHTRSISVVSFFGQPGDLQRREWAMLYILLARMSGAAPANGVAGVVVRQGTDWRVLGYYEDEEEAASGRTAARKRIHIDRLISGLEFSKENITAFCEWRYGVAPW